LLLNGTKIDDCCYANQNHKYDFGAVGIFARGVKSGYTYVRHSGMLEGLNEPVAFFLLIMSIILVAPVLSECLRLPGSIACEKQMWDK
jgi:hypothetical protein